MDSVVVGALGVGLVVGVIEVFVLLVAEVPDVMVDLLCVDLVVG